MMGSVSRRQFLRAAFVVPPLGGLLSGAAAVPPVASAAPATDAGSDLVKTGQFFFPRLQFQCTEEVPDKWDVHPIGDQKIREAIKKLTNINILTDPVVVNLDRLEEMCQYPFVFMTSEGHFKLSERNIATLREYLLRGGFLFADDCVLLGQGDRFFQSFLSEMKRAFPENPMRPVPNTHELLTCFFKLPGVPHTQGVRHPAMGLFEKGTDRLMCIATSGDIHCGWVGFSNLSRDECRRSVEFGVNVVVYCLTH